MAWPTTSDPRTEFVTVRFTVAEASDIDWLVQQTGARSRSAAVREAVDTMIEVEKQVAASKTSKHKTPSKHNQKGTPKS